VAFSGDGTYLAAADNSIYTVVNTLTGQQSCRLTRMRAIALSHDRIAAQNGRGVIRIRDLATGRVLLSLKETRGQLWREPCLVFSPQSMRPNRLGVLAYGTSENRVFLWRVDDSRPLAKLQAHTSDIRRIIFAKEHLISAADEEIFIYYMVGCGQRGPNYILAHTIHSALLDRHHTRMPWTVLSLTRNLLVCNNYGHIYTMRLGAPDPSYCGYHLPRHGPVTPDGLMIHSSIYVNAANGSSRVAWSAWDVRKRQTVAKGVAPHNATVLYSAVGQVLATVSCGTPSFRAIVPIEAKVVIVLLATRARLPPKVLARLVVACV